MSEQWKVTSHLWNDWMGVAGAVTQILGKRGRGLSEKTEQLIREDLLYRFIGEKYSSKEGEEPRHIEVHDRPYFTENIHRFSEKDQQRWKELHQMVLDANALLERIREVSLPSLEVVVEGDVSCPVIRFTKDSPVIPLLKELRELIIKAGTELYGHPPESITNQEVVF